MRCIQGYRANMTNEELLQDPGRDQIEQVQRNTHTHTNLDAHRHTHICVCMLVFVCVRVCVCERKREGNEGKCLACRKEPDARREGTSAGRQIDGPTDTHTYTFSLSLFLSITHRRSRGSTPRASGCASSWNTTSSRITRGKTTNKRTHFNTHTHTLTHTVTLKHTHLHTHTHDFPHTGRATPASLRATAPPCKSAPPRPPTPSGEWV